MASCASRSTSSCLRLTSTSSAVRSRPRVASCAKPLELGFPLGERSLAPLELLEPAVEVRMLVLLAPRAPSPARLAPRPPARRRRAGGRSLPESPHARRTALPTYGRRSPRRPGAGSPPPARVRRPSADARPAPPRALRAREASRPRAARPQLVPSRDPLRARPSAPRARRAASSRPRSPAHARRAPPAPPRALRGEQPPSPAAARARARAAWTAGASSGSGADASVSGGCCRLPSWARSPVPKPRSTSWWESFAAMCTPQEGSATSAAGASPKWC